ncbi:MAG: cytochrome c [Rhodospirillaceae bacterium]|nr:cytochrome c [Rhodospirillaceae bacterium]
MNKLILISVLALSSTVALAASSVERGKSLYMKVGCYQCHGTVGQGGTAGLKLAPSPLPFEQFAQFVHNTADAMPPYREQVLSDADLKDIHAYLASIPQPKPLKQYPLLKDLP